MANSIVREAVAGGYFVGKSKLLYDYLYSRTRGAITPVRSVSITKPALMKGSGIGSERTLLKNLHHLRMIGLVEVNFTDGKHAGNEYTVFLPEEAEPRTPPTPPTPRHAPQKVGYLPPVESGVRGVGSNPLESGSYEESKTFIKTIENNDDDEAFADLIAALKQSSINITGKAPCSAERQRWRQLGELLAAELEIAASRTTVSSVPAFLTTHLRRRLFKTDAGQIDREAAEAHEGQKADEQAQQERRRHLDGEQLQQQVNKMVELMRRGRSMQELDEELAAGFQPVQWHMIRGMALAQLKVGGGDAKREEEQGK